MKTPRLLFLIIVIGIISGYPVAGGSGEWIETDGGVSSGIYRFPANTVESPGARAPVGEPRLREKRSSYFTEVIDSLSVKVGIRPGEALVIGIDPTAEILSVFYPDDGLSSVCSAAVAASPEWLRERLALQLPHFGSMADSVAQEILDASTETLDEIAFVTAHLSPEMALDSRFDAELITENAEWIYRLADSLPYVELVEDATPGNTMTTTRYRCVDLSATPPDTIWMEIPHDVYYWWVVHPALTDEAPKMRDSGSETQQQTYGYFWREFLWTDPDPSHSYTSGGYPLLPDYMKGCRFLWCRRDTMFDGMRTLSADDGALNALGNWTFRVVPNAPVSPRPIQPNQIAYRHGGNCGEIQDLFMAAARTSLIPATGTMDRLEDHVWNEFYDDVYLDPADSLGWNNFPPTQVNRWDYGGHTYLAPHWAGYDDQRGGSKDVSFVWNYRGDALLDNRIDQYSHSCSLVVRVFDSHGDPVDGAVVQLYSDTPGGDPGYVYLGAVAVTGANGYARFAGGENNPYYARATSAIGEAPATSVVLLSSDASAGGYYTANINLPGELPQLDISTATEPSESTEIGITVEWEAVAEIARGENIMQSQNASCCDFRSGGRITSALFDADEYTNWESSLTANAWLYNKRTQTDTASFVFPDTGEFYFVLSNEEGLGNDQIVELELSLCRIPAGIAEKTEMPEEFSISAYPNPFNSSVTITAPVGAEVEVFDVNGRLVSVISMRAVPKEKSPTNPQEISRQARNDNERRFVWQPDETVGSGIYFIRVSTTKGTQTKKLVYLR